MADPDAGRPASEVIGEFIEHLAERGFAASTRRIRRHFLTEYLSHAQQRASTQPLTAAELMEPARAEAWLADAAAGKTRTRNTIRGPEAAAYPNSMRVRIDSWNGFAEFLGLAGRRDTERPAPGFTLTPEDTERLLHDLSVKRPVYSNAMTALRTAAVAALVADTGLGVPELARLRVSALRLDGANPHVDVGEDTIPLSGATVHILSRWLSARAAIIAELEGSDPGHLWIPTKPGRPRGGEPSVKPGITPAAVRTLHHAHRVLVSQLLGAPLRPGALRELSELSETSQTSDLS
jgi:integrase